ncbi:MAG: hypothetical protein JXK95_17240 [Bacteroidales bacterium]|nr:hypothetical protein [Bacteroidales bacterium]
MIENENIYDKIQELFGDVSGQLSILEDQIDLNVQTEYYNYSKKVNDSLNPEEIIKNKDELFQADLPVEDRKNMLVRLAAVDDIEAYRTLEKYIKEPNPGLRDWAYLALQESRMLIESKILDENQILISTGLGGKGLKLRYFVAIISSNKMAFTPLQQKIVREEFKYYIGRSEGELEEIVFDNEICSLISIIPLKIPVQTLFTRIITECNLLGNFIQNDFVITNVKILTSDEIRIYIK